MYLPKLRGKVAEVSKQDLGALFRSERKAKGWTQEQLEEKTGLPQSVISRIENTGEGQDESRLAIARELGIPASTMWKVLGGETGIPEVEYGPEVLNIAKRIKELSPRARLHIEAQLELLEMIPSEKLPNAPITQAEARQAQAILDKYRKELEEETKRKEQHNELN